MTNKYILLNQAFCEANTNAINEKGKFNYGITNDGYYVAAYQTLLDFPELFINDNLLEGISILQLDKSDFPQPNLFN